uniref:tripartite motif-containing protein 14-like n=1 Tax=Myxine glutinosa TaxID=7769 RepID=UPI00358FBE2C
MSSKEENGFVTILSRNGPNIIDALLHGPEKAFDEARRRDILDREDLDRITSKESNADKIRACLKVIEGKGEHHSRVFVEILHKLKVKRTYPRLQSWTDVVFISGSTHICCEMCDQEAAKLCAACEILCCEQHLKSHRQKWHKLVELGIEVEELICTDHRKPMELYCMDDWRLMCPICIIQQLGQHDNHKVVNVESAQAELKGILAEKLPQISMTIQSLESQLQQIQQEEEQSQLSDSVVNDMLEGKRREWCHLVNESVDVMKSHINKKQNEKLSLLARQREKLEQQMKSLLQAQSTLKTAIQKLEGFSFLQGCSDLQKRVMSISDFKVIKRATPTVLDFSKEEKNLDLIIEFNKNLLKKIEREPVEQRELATLDHNSMQILYGRSPSLDPNSAHPRISITQDLRTATQTPNVHPYSKHPDRFDSWDQVLSSEGFSSGCHYWEVDVSLSRWFRIGVALNSMGRKGGGRESGLGRNIRSWCVRKFNDKYTACHNEHETPLSVSGDPERFGFFLDCEVGELRCFVESQLLHVFIGKFTDSVKPAIGIGSGKYLRSGFWSVGSGSVRFCSL